MSGGMLPLEIYTGADFKKILTWTANGTPVDTTGYTATMLIKPDLRSTEILATLSTSNGGITFGGSNGQVTLYLPASDTKAIITSSGVYDLKYTPLGSTEVDILLYGPVKFIRGVN